jgi:hypothetical protein
MFVCYKDVRGERSMEERRNSKEKNKRKLE